MTLFFTRIFALFTLFSYLTVGTVAVRFFTAGTEDFSLSLDYFSMLKGGSLKTAEMMQVNAPKIAFNDIKFPVKPVIVATQKAKITSPVIYKVNSASLPFHEAVVLEKLTATNELPSNLLALYKAAPEAIVEMVAKAEVVVPVTNQADEVSTKMARSEIVKDVLNDEPTFLDYSEEVTPAAAAVAATEAAAVAASAVAVTKTPSTTKEFTQIEVESTSTTQAASTENIVPTEEVVAEVEAVDNNTQAVDKVSGAVDNLAVTNPNEEVAVDDLIAFDYSSANKAIVENKMPTVTNVTNQVPVAQNAATPAATTWEVSTVNKSSPSTSASSASSEIKTKDKVIDASGFQAEDKQTQKAKQTPKSKGYASEVIVHAAGTNLKKNFDLNGFEIRFHDDLSLAVEDFGSGVITLKETLAQPAMTRSVFLLKRGYAPTHTDLILENGVTELSLPLIEENKFNDLIAPFEKKGSVGAVLVELDDETELATLDVPFGKVILLNGDMKVTKDNDHRYQLFVGVKAGNALLSYKNFKSQTISKVVHIHERELTFEANLYESVANETVTLFEEDLLAREKSPLIIGSEQVKKFATDIESKKISDHNYKVDFDRHLLANRRYLEISHQSEPVFIGVRDVTKVIVPSENFMRFVLSRLEGAKLGNRCLVQVNLSRKVERVDVGSESVDNALETFTQMLDSDGKFYDSISEKTRKVIIVGDNQGAEGYGQDGKINLKVTYVDGTVQYLSSYCSPNSYLVEQL
ncbi:MAG TPA: hypothetical protein VNJ08_09100 [Bacteriovoracaceae bacterium]|nr:hypothetical protein [Bacteriovoracaceae bacterium]